MKKLTVLGLLIVGAITSCQKEEFYEEAAQKATPAKSTHAIASATWGKNLTTGAAPDYCCDPPATDCYDDLIITPTNYNGIRNDIMGATPVNIRNFFSGTTWHGYMPGLLNQANAVDLADLQSGNFFVEEKINPTNGHKFLMIKEVGSSDPKYVFQFIVETPPVE